jgi:hypothetical protein
MIFLLRRGAFVLRCAVRLRSIVEQARSTATPRIGESQVQWNFAKPGSG